MVKPEDGPVVIDGSVAAHRCALLASWLMSAGLHVLILLLLAWRLVTIPSGSLGIALRCQSGATAFYEEDGEEPGRGMATLVSQMSAKPDMQLSSPVADLFSEPPPVDPSTVLPALKPPGDEELPEAGDTASRSRDMGDETLGGARPRSAQRSTAEARTSVFGIPGQGTKFVYVFDRSASMGGAGRSALGAAKSQLLASLRDLDQRHQFQIIFYNDRPLGFRLPGQPMRLVYATQQNKALAMKFVNSVVADGATGHEEALEMAIGLRPDVVYFLTDADEPKLWPQQLAKIHRLAAGITIHAIEFGFGREAEADNFLVRLARENGGQHGYVDVSHLVPVTFHEEPVSAGPLSRFSADQSTR